MRKQTLIWTALPDGSNGPLQAGTQLKLSVYLSPRLWSDTPNVNEELGDYPDFLDWPAAVKQASFQVEFGSGGALNATPDFTPLRSDLWKALFDSNTLVIPFVFEDFSGMDFQGDQLSMAYAALKEVYQDVATSTVYGQGMKLPKADALAAHPILDAIGRPYVPKPPLPAPPPQRPLIIEGYPPPELPVPGEEPTGCLKGCLLLPVRLLMRLVRLLGMLLTLPFAAVSPGQAKTSMDAVVAFHKPFTEAAEPMPTKQEIERTYDFHQMISNLGDHRLLLRAMGLVVDVTVTLAAPLPAGTSTVRVQVTMPLQMAATTPVSMKLHYDLADGVFRARPRPADPEISNGLLRLNEPDKFQLIQVDATGGVIKLFNLASNLRVLGFPVRRPVNSPEDTGLPALRNGGLSLVKPDRAKTIHLKTVKSYALNLFAAGLDNSPVHPITAAEPAPAASDELYAEDVTRGYRIDVRDDHTGKWRSLCQRVGTYDFGGGLVESGWKDEGVVVLGATNKLNPAAPDIKMRIGETLITWDGWSLVAPRPGQTILDEYTDAAKTENKTEYPGNPAATLFPLSTTFQAENGTLPRLRFGHKYRLRARVVDLAGNSTFGPGNDAAFQADPAEKSAEVPYNRFDPVAPPPLVLLTEPEQGEALERIVVRSSIDQPAAAIAALKSQRHIVPPKASQLMAEQHELFDGAQKMLSGQADYDRASREAGTLVEYMDLATGKLAPAPGAVEVVQYRTDPVTNQPVPDENGAPIVLRRVWLQKNEKFVLNYLPDPFARGVLLLGLPGMSSFDEVIEPGATIVNKIPFEGAWPNPAPLRLELRGLKDGEAGPAAPAWDPSARLLTVQLHQGVTANVQISSYFLADDLKKMGIWQWTEETGTPDLAKLESSAVQGRSWLHQPFRSLVLVHAVQQPLAIPDITAMTSTKQLGETHTSLTGTIVVDRKSTGKLDLLAAWADPLDDPDDPANDPSTAQTQKQMYVKEILLQEGGTDQVKIGEPQVPAIKHELSDTKHHVVTYQAPGTTRFREYMDAKVLADPANLMRPTPTEQGTAPALQAMIEVDVENSARPRNANPVHVLPVFPWTETTAGDVVTHLREGGWLRVYLDRPWFSSGVGELLGVLMRPTEVDAQSELAEAMKPYTSQWGSDPVWASSNLQPLRLEHFANKDPSSRPDLPLAELKRQNQTDHRVVDVAAFKPEYDSDRGLWFCDISFNPGQVASYFPFVRLALARFQPSSVFSADGLDSAHLSRVVLADYIQLAPRRQVEYDRKNVPVDNTLSIKVQGPAGFRGQLSTVMLVSFAKRDPRVLDEKDDLGWQQVGEQAALQMHYGETSMETSWTGTVQLPSPAPSPLRVLVQELEVFPSEEDSAVEVPPLTDVEQPQPGVGMAEFAQLRTRVVFADALVLP